MDKQAKEKIRELELILSHMMNRQILLFEALGLVKVGSITGDEHWDVIRAREDICTTLKYHKSIGEGGREEVEAGYK